VKASGEVSTVIVIAEYFVAFYSTHNDMMNEIGDIESRESWHVMEHSLCCKGNQATTSLFTPLYSPFGSRLSADDEKFFGVMRATAVEQICRASNNVPLYFSLLILLLLWFSELHSKSPFG
jgi:hypothetical protein